MKKIVVLFGFVSLIFLQNNFLVSAHGSAFAYQETKEGYFIDIDRDVEFPIALEPIRLDFTTYLEDLSIEEDDIFTDVWVRISQDRTLFFSGGINKPVFGPTGFTFVFPEEGEYEVTARFQNEGDTVVETSLTLDVLPPAVQETEINPLVAVGAGAVLGLLVGYFIPRKKK